MDIEGSFNRIRWHDAKITSFAVNRVSDVDNIEANVILTNGPIRGEGVIVFENCVYFESKLYLSAKMICSDDISGASCFLKSDWIERLSLENPYDGFAGFYHFQITFIPPGGVMNILASSFSINVMDKLPMSSV
jgi:hypothetical protein